MKYLISFFLVLSSLLSIGQHSAELLDSCNDILLDRGEVYVAFPTQSKAVQEKLYRVLSFDHGSDLTTSLAYIPADMFGKFLEFDIPFQIVDSYYNAELNIKMLTKEAMLTRMGECRDIDWDFYPTYDAYVAMMEQFATDFPELCEFHSLGTLDSGREILALKITDNVSEDEDEPKFLYTSSMHGDELAGYPISLRFADFILCNYDTDERIAEILDNVEIWINPLANPDGAYRNDNSTVLGARRGNGNGRDLNRNFPDPEDGDHPDGQDYQEETVIFMDFAEREQFNMSANFHGGIELFNYPWDTFSALPADVDWWLCLGEAYRDTVHAHAPNGYFTGRDNGVTNGWDWFEVRGGRQDYMIYNFGGREFTLELSDRKLLNSEDLPDIWEYNYRSLLNYLEEANNGLRGIITDDETGEPIEAEVFIDGHDELNSQVHSKLPYGSYYRYLDKGEFFVTYSADDYVPQTLPINMVKGEQSIQDVALSRILSSTAELDAEQINVWMTDTGISIDTDLQNFAVRLLDQNGKTIFATANISTSSVDTPLLPSGIYVVEIIYQQQKRAFKVLR